MDSRDQSAAAIIASSLLSAPERGSYETDAAAILEALAVNGFAVVKNHQTASGCGCVFSARFGPGRTADGQEKPL